MTDRVEISYKTIIFTIATIAGVWLIWQLLEVIFLLFVALILVAALRSPVEWLTAKKVPRILAIVLVYFLILLLISLVSIIIIPALNNQYKTLVQQAPYLIEQINRLLIFVQIPTDQTVSILSQPFIAVGKNLFKITTSAFGTLVGLITLLVLTFYLILEWEKVVKLIASPFTGRQEKRVMVFVTTLERDLGRWLRGQLTLSFIVGILVYVGLAFLGIPAALPLALIAGILEIIPIIGPILSAVPALIIALTLSPILAIVTAALYFIVQQLENNLIVPTVMSKTVGVNPLVTIIALMIGAKLAGIIGVILAVPTVLVIRTIFKHLVVVKEEPLEIDA